MPRSFPRNSSTANSFEQSELPDIRLRKANKKDRRRLVRLLAENGLPYEDILSRKHCIFIANTESSAVGIGGLEIHENYGLLRSLVIEKPFRGNGYGASLCNKLMDQARLHGVEEAYLLTTTAERFFEKIGFDRVDRNAVPPAIQNTTEFRSLCPKSAVCMKMRIR